MKFDISLEKAKQNKLFYVVITGVIYHPKKKKCLILQRSFKEKVHPGLWGVVGGKMEWEDLQNTPPNRQNHDVSDWVGLVDRQLEREAFEESGLVVEDARYLENVVFLRPDKVPVVLIQFALKYKSGKVKIAPEFEAYTWVNEKDVSGYELIKGIKEEIIQTLRIYA